MVQELKIPKHGGPDGQGLSSTSFNSLCDLISNKDVDTLTKKKAIELCLSASTQQQWNDEYRDELIKRIS